MAESFRERHWTKCLPDGFVVQVYLETNRGQILSFAAALIKDGACITRYDNAHGFSHRDVIGQKSASTLWKERFDTLTLNEVFNYAIKDLSENYAELYEYYCKH